MWGCICQGCLRGRVPGFFGIRDLRYLKAGIRDFKAKWGRDSVLKVCKACGMPQITVGLYTRLSENLSREDGIEQPYWRSSRGWWGGRSIGIPLSYSKNVSWNTQISPIYPKLKEMILLLLVLSCFTTEKEQEKLWKHWTWECLTEYLDEKLC